MSLKGSSEPKETMEEMTCEDVRDLLYLFVTNELDEEFEAVCSHLVGCADCRKAMAEHVKLAGSLSRAVVRTDLRYYSRNN